MSSFNIGNKLTACVVGNPNAGKSTFFNHLTNANALTGNWPGVTVKARTQAIVLNHKEINIVDLPGSYALRANCTAEERATQYFLTNEKVDLIIQVIDVNMLQRSLYLTVQLLSLRKPLVIVLNKVDLISFNQAMEITEKLQAILKIPVFAVSSREKSNFSILLEYLGKSEAYDYLAVDLLNFVPEPVRHAVQELQAIYPDISIGNESLREILSNHERAKAVIQAHYGDNIEIALMDMWHSIAAKINGLVQIKEKQTTTVSDHMDAFLLNKKIGIPIFLCVMYMMFFFSIQVGGIFQDFFGLMAQALFVIAPQQALSYLGFDHDIVSTIVTGVGTGLATVAEFIPVIGGLYLFLSILEESGYLARAAFIMNKFLIKLGLQGKALIPLIMGFGCNVPAIMATRIIDDRRSRLAVIMAIPFLSCSARLSVFAVFGSIFFEHNAAAIIFLLYLLGIGFGILTIVLINVIGGKKRDVRNFVIEMPDYQLPTINAVLNKTFSKLREFIFGAGKLIVIICVILQALHSFSLPNQKDPALVTMSKFIVPIFKPIGISEENWPAAVGLITGLMAKEVVIGTLSALYSSQNIDDEQHTIQETMLNALNSIQTNALLIVTGDTDEELNTNTMNIIKKSFGSTLAAFTYLLFVLLYFPCISVFAVISKEFSRKWAILSGLWSTIAAYASAVLCYQVGLYCLNDSYSITAVILAFAAVLAIVISLMKNARKE